MQEDYGNMDMEDFTHGLYRNMLIIKWTLLAIFILEAVSYVSK